MCTNVFYIIGLQNQNFERRLQLFTCLSVLTYVVGAQKKRLIETMLLVYPQHIISVNIMVEKQES